MATQLNDSMATFTANEALEAFRCVNLVSGSGTNVEYTDAGEVIHGVTQHAVASGDQVTCKLWHKGMTFKVEVGEAVSEGGSLYTVGAAGKLGDTDPGAATIRARALEAGTGDGSIIEVLPV